MICINCFMTRRAVFWNVKQYRVKEWYRGQQRKDDLVISASPEFLLEEICRRLEIENLIASKGNANVFGYLHGSIGKGSIYCEGK